MTRPMTIYTAIYMAAMIFLPRQAIAQGEVGIGPGTPDPSAILDASSTTKGISTTSYDRSSERCYCDSFHRVNSVESGK